jgi:thiamine-phosphate pyrophosphorylase
VTPSLVDRLALVVITDPDCGAGRDLVDVARAALQGGAGALQLRAKGETTREMVELGRRLKAETAAAGALLFVNDRVDVALVIGADGAHVGDDDLPLDAARAIAGCPFLIGRSVDTVEEARLAERHSTPSKLDAAPAIGVPGIGAIAAATSLPVVAIGGVDVQCAEAVARAGAVGVAVIRAVMQAGDPADAARQLTAAVRRGRPRP